MPIDRLLARCGQGLTVPYSMIDTSTRLRRAIHLRDAPLVRRIVKANPKLLENPDFEDKGNTSLHIAAKHGFKEIAVRWRDLQLPQNVLSDCLEGSAIGRWPRCHRSVAQRRLEHATDARGRAWSCRRGHATH